MKPKQQNLNHIDKSLLEIYSYVVVTTLGKYKRSREFVYARGFNDFAEARAYYKLSVNERAQHVCIVDTSAVVGLYIVNRDGDVVNLTLRSQVYLSAYGQ